MSRFVNSLEEFLELDYKMIINPFEEEGEKGYVVSCPEINGLEVYGETLEEALEEVKESKIALYEMYTSEGKRIPYPKNYMAEDVSGRITIRIPKTLHQRIKSYSQENKVSLNTGINQLLNDGIYHSYLQKMEQINKQLYFTQEYNVSEHESEFYPLISSKLKPYFRAPKFNYDEESSFSVKQ